jgi:flagellar biogenesis protein FliO
VNLLKTWFARQSLTVKLIVCVPLLLAAVLWSLTPEDPAPASPGAAPNRPVLSADSPAALATIAPHQEPRAADSGLSWVTALRTIVSIVVVVGLIVLSARGLKHVLSNAGQLPGASGNLKVLDTTYLPSPNGRGRAAIHLVETTDGRHLLVGATDTQLTLLAELDEQPRAAAVETRSESGSPVALAEPARPARFDEVLERLRQSARTLEQAS